MALGADSNAPSFARQTECRYCVMRDSGSSALAGRGASNTTTIAALIHVLALMMRSEVVLHAEFDQSPIQRRGWRQPVCAVGAVDPEDSIAVQQVIDVEIELVPSAHRP